MMKKKLQIADADRLGQGCYSKFGSNKERKKDCWQGKKTAGKEKKTAGKGKKTAGKEFRESA